MRGEGKTTVSIGLAMGMRRLGRRAAVCIREPSLGPVFGNEGRRDRRRQGRVVPADDINLHFTGDLHAITSAHNLLAALMDNALHFGVPVALDPRRARWPRVLDMNDRSLRDIVIGLGPRGSGFPRQTRFDITAASEVMAILCLSRSPEDLRARLARIVVGETPKRVEVTAAELHAESAMYSLLRDALLPNLVQTSEGGPAFVHGGPFANLAHGCSSVLATRLAAHYADDVITEAGFGFDLGGEKLLHIKCRTSGLLAALRGRGRDRGSLAVHGNGELLRGLRHLDRQLANVSRFGLPAVVALNVFPRDAEVDLGRIEAHCGRRAYPSPGAMRSHGVARGPRTSPARWAPCSTRPTPVRPLLGPSMTSAHPTRRSSAPSPPRSTERPTSPSPRGRTCARPLRRDAPRAPVCVAKTHISFSDDPKGGGLAEGFVPTVTDAAVLAGAGFVRASMGDVHTMPGLPRDPAAARIRVDADGKIRGLMQGD